MGLLATFPYFQELNRTLAQAWKSIYRIFKAIIIFTLVVILSDLCIVDRLFYAPQKL